MSRPTGNHCSYAIDGGIVDPEVWALGASSQSGSQWPGNHCSVEALVEQQRLTNHAAAILQQAFPMPLSADAVAAEGMAPVSSTVLRSVAVALDELVAAGAASTAPRFDGERCWLWWPSGAARAQERRLR